MYRSCRAEAYGRRKKRLFEVEGVDRSASDEAPLTITRDMITDQLAQWQEVIADTYRRLEGCWDEDGCCNQLGEIANALHAQRRKGPVLNVLDEEQRYYVDGDGRGNSGNWLRPEKSPTRIRVYQSKEDQSVAGGATKPATGQSLSLSRMRPNAAARGPAVASAPMAAWRLPNNNALPCGSMRLEEPAEMA
jgi:hypothetical protein